MYSGDLIAVLVVLSPGLVYIYKIYNKKVVNMTRKPYHGINTDDLSITLILEQQAVFIVSQNLKVRSGVAGTKLRVPIEK